MMKFEVDGPHGQRLQAWLDPYYSWKGEPHHRLRIMYRKNDAATLAALPMRLALSSRLCKLWLSVHPHWPPQWVTQIGNTDGQTWFEYEDEWTHERTLFKPALWRANYLSEKRHWTIEKLRDL